MNIISLLLFGFCKYMLLKMLLSTLGHNPIQYSFEKDSSHLRFATSYGAVLVSFDTDSRYGSKIRSPMAKTSFVYYNKKSKLLLYDNYYYGRRCEIID